MRPILSVSLLSLLACATGCPGELDVSNLPPVYADSGPQTYSYSDTSPIYTPTPDLGPAQGNTDAIAPTSDSQLAPDTLAPTPDTTTPVSTGDGQPCPCSGGAVCFNGVCRVKCTAPTDPCQAVASCPAIQGCVNTSAGYSLCLPATAQPGATCGGTLWCPVNYVCGSVNGSGYACLPLCNVANAACGTGGTCLKASSGCMFCSKN